MGCDDDLYWGERGFDIWESIEFGLWGVCTAYQPDVLSNFTEFLVKS